MTPKHDYRFSTLALHGGQPVDSFASARAPPIYQTTSFLFEDTAHAADLFALKKEGNIYTRIMNPTTGMFEKRVALLEGGAGALGVASGQAAETIALLNIVESGDEIVSSSDLYGGTYTLLNSTFKRLGIHVKFVDQSDPANFEHAITKRTKILYTETLGNPRLRVPDIPSISKIAHEHGIPYIIDNTVPSPYLCRPISHGVDIVIHSATKYLGGHGTSIGGVIVDSGTFPWDEGPHASLNAPDPSYHGMIFTQQFGNSAFIARARVVGLRDFGPALSPFNAFLFLQGMETLPLRMKAHCKNAQAVAEFLEDHSKVSWVNFPGLPDHPTHDRARELFGGRGFGAMIGFGIKGGMEAGKNFIENVTLLSHLANIGDAKSLCIHPASTTHQQLTKEEQVASGVTQDYIRLSIGIEDEQDIIEDIDQALQRA
ncbi:aminotransferase class V-fold PLP-dependent enzyme [Candidatus Bathyarchaeota archaeon]|nr:aminotransferase class V-fold PLP-dependent enzyme [Candidatus Bathyarchaeota archaeon]